MRRHTLAVSSSSAVHSDPRPTKRHQSTYPSLRCRRRRRCLYSTPGIQTLLPCLSISSPFLNAANSGCSYSRRTCTYFIQRRPFQLRARPGSIFQGEEVFLEVSFPSFIHSLQRSWRQIAASSSVFLRRREFVASCLTVLKKSDF